MKRKQVNLDEWICRLLKDWSKQFKLSESHYIRLAIAIQLHVYAEAVGMESDVSLKELMKHITQVSIDKTHKQAVYDRVMFSARNIAEKRMKK